MLYQSHTPRVVDKKSSIVLNQKRFEQAFAGDEDGFDLLYAHDLILYAKLNRLLRVDTEKIIVFARRASIMAVGNLRGSMIYGGFR